MLHVPHDSLQPYIYLLPAINTPTSLLIQRAYTWQCGYLLNTLAKCVKVSMKHWDHMCLFLSFLISYESNHTAKCISRSIVSKGDSHCVMKICKHNFLNPSAYMHCYRLQGRRKQLGIGQANIPRLRRTAEEALSRHIARVASWLTFSTYFQQSGSAVVAPL